MDDEARHVAVLLAAGGSTRLGRAKQLLRRDGETLVHRAARLARATAPRQLLIVLGAHESMLRAELADIDATILCNPQWHTGLAGSLHCAARALSGNTAPALILGCDQPALELAHLQRLIVQADAAPSRCAAVLHAGVPGIPALVSAAMLDAAAGARGDHGLRASLRALPRTSIALLDAPELCRDIDTDVDVELAIAAGLLDRSVDEYSKLAGHGPAPTGAL